MNEPPRTRTPLAAALAALALALALLVTPGALAQSDAEPSATEAAPAERAGLAIVVTGCDSGFGRSLAVALAVKCGVRARGQRAARVRRARAGARRPLRRSARRGVRWIMRLA